MQRAGLRFRLSFPPTPLRREAQCTGALRSQGPAGRLPTDPGEAQSSPASGQDYKSLGLAFSLKTHLLYLFLQCPEKHLGTRQGPMTVRPLLTSLPPATCCFSGGLSVVGSWVGGLSPASRQHTSGWSWNTSTPLGGTPPQPVPQRGARPSQGGATWSIGPGLWGWVANGTTQHSPHGTHSRTQTSHGTACTTQRRLVPLGLANRDTLPPRESYGLNQLVPAAWALGPTAKPHPCPPTLMSQGGQQTSHAPDVRAGAVRMYGH